MLRFWCYVNNNGENEGRGGVWEKGGKAVTLDGRNT